jgi:hypothetical protein
MCRLHLSGSVWLPGYGHVYMQTHHHCLVCSRILLGLVASCDLTVGGGTSLRDRAALYTLLRIHRLTRDREIRQNT